MSATRRSFFKRAGAVLATFGIGMAARRIDVPAAVQKFEPALLDDDGQCYSTGFCHDPAAYMGEVNWKEINDNE